MCPEHPGEMNSITPSAHSLSHKHIIQVADKLPVKETNLRLKSGTALSIKCLGVDEPAGGGQKLLSPGGVWLQQGVRNSV